MRRTHLSFWLLALLPALLASPANAEEFYLKNGDRVVFYGDSITDQRLYTTFTEVYVVTRFPKLDVAFIHSGWGGDRVGGGGGGPIDRRLKRDVFAYKPTVMTVMLGMNDASYRAFDQKIFDTYEKGYEHIVASVKEHVPGIRMTLIVPSPFDDVTRKPNFEGGYNAVLLRYGEFVRELAKKNGLDVADLNTSVVEATKKAFESDPMGAPKLNPDRVHPGPSGQLLMAAALLKAWNAPALVSMAVVKIEGDKAQGSGDKTKLTELNFTNGELSWSQLDESLPFPIDFKDQVVGLAVRSSDVVETLDQQTLKVTGLEKGDYELKIDGEKVAKFSTEQLERGVNLATYETPMSKQAASVLAATKKHNDLHFQRWRSLEVPYENLNKEGVAKTNEGMDMIEATLVKQQRAAAQPKPRSFRLSKES
jgi:lysophospholipase L1-like esterase